MCELRLNIERQSLSDLFHSDLVRTYRLLLAGFRLEECEAFGLSIGFSRTIEDTPVQT